MVKAFNHIGSAHPTEHAQPSGSANRRALLVAGDDAAAEETVTRLIDELGFDVVDAGSLADSWRIQPDTPGYGPRLDAAGMREALAAPALTVGRLLPDGASWTGHGDRCPILNRTLLQRPHLLERTSESGAGSPTSTDDLSGALERREAVRLLLMRGTVHLVTAADAPGL